MVSDPHMQVTVHSILGLGTNRKAVIDALGLVGFVLLHWAGASIFGCSRTNQMVNVITELSRDF